MAKDSILDGVLSLVYCYLLISGYFTDAACKWSFKTPVKILTYSVHTHSLGMNNHLLSVRLFHPY